MDARAGKDGGQGLVKSVAGQAERLFQVEATPNGGMTAGRQTRCASRAGWTRHGRYGLDGYVAEASGMWWPCAAAVRPLLLLEGPCASARGFRVGVAR